MKFGYEKFNVYGIKSPKPSFGFFRINSLQKGVLVNCFYLNYRNIIKNEFIFKSIFFKEGFREILLLKRYWQFKKNIMKIFGTTLKTGRTEIWNIRHRY